MNNDLIRREDVLRLIDELGYTNVHDGRDYEANSRMDKVRQGVNELPIAYDMDAVLKQLQQNGQKMSEAKVNMGEGPAHRYYKGISVKKASEIVSSGGNPMQMEKNKEIEAEQEERE